MKSIILCIVLLLTAGYVHAQSTNSKECSILECALKSDTLRKFFELNGAEPKMVEIADPTNVFDCASVLVHGKTYKLVNELSDLVHFKVEMKHYKNTATVTLTDVHTTGIAIVYLLRKKGEFEITGLQLDYAEK